MKFRSCFTKTHIVGGCARQTVAPGIFKTIPKPHVSAAYKSFINSPVFKHKLFGQTLLITYTPDQRFSKWGPLDKQQHSRKLVRKFLGYIPSPSESETLGTSPGLWLTSPPSVAEVYSKFWQTALLLRGQSQVPAEGHGRGGMLSKWEGRGKPKKGKKGFWLSSLGGQWIHSTCSEPTTYGFGAKHLVNPPVRLIDTSTLSWWSKFLKVSIGQTFLLWEKVSEMLGWHLGIAGVDPGISQGPFFVLMSSGTLQTFGILPFNSRFVLCPPRSPILSSEWVVCREGYSHHPLVAEGAHN